MMQNTSNAIIFTLYAILLSINHNYFLGIDQVIDFVENHFTQTSQVSHRVNDKFFHEVFLTVYLIQFLDRFQISSYAVKWSELANPKIDRLL